MVKNAIFVLISGMCALAMATWEPIGPYGGALYTMTVSSSNEDIIYAATYGKPGRIMRSTNSGNEWMTVSTLPDEYSVHCLATDINDPGIVYAGSYQRIYKSYNGGVDWVCYPVSADTVEEIVVHPDSPSKIFCTGRVTCGDKKTMGFFKSTDGGVTWDSLALHTVNGIAFCMTLDPANYNVIYVGGVLLTTFTGKVYKSTNGGVDFFDASSGIGTSGSAYICDLEVHPTNSDIIYAAGYAGGIYRSTDGGAYWTREWSLHTVYDISTTRTEPDFVYAGTRWSVYKSTDAGDTWFDAGAGLSGRRIRIRSVIASQAQTEKIYAASRVGFFKTSNGGVSWLRYNYGMNVISVIGFAVAPSCPSVIYMTTDEACEYKTIDCGGGWVLLPEVHVYHCTSMLVHNNDPDVVFATGSG